MVNGTFNRAAVASLAIPLLALLIACGGSDEGLSRTDVEQIVREVVSDLEEPDPEITDAAAEKKTDGGTVSAPRKSEPSEYTKFLVNKAISRYEAEGLEAAAAYYNTKESIDGQSIWATTLTWMSEGCRCLSLGVLSTGAIVLISVVSLSSHTLGTRIRTVSGRRV